MNIPEPNASKPFYSVQEVAAIFEVQAYTVRQWLNDGHMQGVKPGGPNGRWKVSVNEVRKVANDKYGAQT